MSTAGRLAGRLGARRRGTATQTHPSAWASTAAERPAARKSAKYFLLQLRPSRAEATATTTTTPAPAPPARALRRREEITWRARASHRRKTESCKAGAKTQPFCPSSSSSASSAAISQRAVPSSSLCAFAVTFRCLSRRPEEKSGLRCTSIRVFRMRAECACKSLEFVVELVGETFPSPLCTSLPSSPCF